MHAVEGPLRMPKTTYVSIIYSPTIMYIDASSMLFITSGDDGGKSPPILLLIYPFSLASLYVRFQNIVL